MEKGDFKQFSKFAVVGVINTLINLVVLFVFTEYLGLYYIYSAIIAFLFAVTNSFILNTLWTFKKNIKHKYMQCILQQYYVELHTLFISSKLLPYQKAKSLELMF